MGFFSNLFGGRDKRGGRRELESAGRVGSSVISAAQPYATQYDRGASESFGRNAGEYMQRAQESARGLAEEQGRAAAQQGTRAAEQAARTAGLNKGQAALAGAQRAGDIYSQTYGQGVQTGVQNYMTGTGQIAGQGSEMAGRQLAGAGLKAGIGGTRANVGQQQSQAAMGLIGNLAGAGAMLSDEEAKEAVQPLDLDEALKRIRPVTYKYKGDDEERVGVLAQDVEESPMDAAVVETPEGKALDTAELAPATLALLASLYQRVRALEGRRDG